MQTTILVVTLVLMGLVTAIFWLCVSRSASPQDKKSAAPALEGYRAALISALAGFSAVVCYFTLTSWPHAAPTTDNPVIVSATGQQWSWELSRDSVPANKPVVFAVTSKDVNHGFGVYDDTGTILFQTQAMPGYINRVAYTFSKPGVYRVLCMEYCAGSHHDMTSEFRVTAQ